MVGTDSKMRLAQLTADLVGREYKLGKMDCFRVVYEYLKMRGGDRIPSVYKGYTLDTYIDLYKEDVDKAKDLMIEFISTFLEEISPKKSIGGDILLARFRVKPPFLGVDAGNGRLLVAIPNIGVTVVLKEYYTLLRGFRCPQQFQ